MTVVCDGVDGLEDGVDGVEDDGVLMVYGWCMDCVWIVYGLCIDVIDT